MFNYTADMKALDERFRESHGGLREWFLAPENRDREVVDLAEELGCTFGSVYNYLARLCLERRGRIVDLQVVEA